MSSHSQLNAAPSVDFYAQVNSLDADAELIQFSGHLNRMFRCYESMYRAHESRTLDDELWAGIHNAITDATTSPGIKAWWPTRSHWYSKSFANYVQELVTSDAEPVLRYARPND